MTAVSGTAIDQAYRDRLNHHEQRLTRLDLDVRKFSATRCYLTYAAGLVAVATYVFDSLSFAWLALAMVLAVAAMAVYRSELRCSQQASDARIKIKIHRRSIARRQREWDAIPDIAVAERLAELPIAVDLDLFGHASLLKLMCTAETRDGIRLLSRWLARPASLDEIRRRQKVAQKLAPRLDWRQGLQQRCNVMVRHTSQTDRLRRWGSNSQTIQLPSLIRNYVIALRFLVPACIVATALQPVVGLSALGLILIVNFAVTVAYSGDVHSFFRGILVTPDSRSYRFLSETFAHVRDSEDLQETVPDIVSTCRDAVDALRRLESILVMESITRNPLLTLFVYMPLQFVVLWDLQVYLRCLNWRNSSGENTEKWFDTLAEVEALASLATLCYEQPEFAFPDLQNGGPTIFDAKNLGHPLLPDASRVANDLSVGPPGTILLVTGSNMGGKSTLLRAIGINAVLAQAGAPCCCTDLRMPQVEVMTSMRVSDSLHDSTSLFMAQLMNLKRIVDYLQATEAGNGSLPVLLLFDEILDGTNTTDRRLAVEKLVGYLLRCNAIGAMTTHDLEIASQSTHSSAFHTFFLGHHLTGPQEDPIIEFDYKLRPGIAPESSAATLLRVLGIPD